jgi:hypothetical protein
MEHKMSLTYHKIEIKEGDILLSPSSLAQLFDNSGSWYKQYILKEKSFSGNDNTYLGSLLHNRIEQYYVGEWIQKDVELAYLDSNGAIDSWVIMNQLEPMYEQWVEQYANKYPKPEHIELALQYSPIEGFVLGGSADAIVGDTITDWKTSSKSKSSLADYKMQLYCYALIARKNGHTINNIQVVNIVKPTTKGEVKVNVLKEPIDDKYMEWFISQLQLQVKRIRLAQAEPKYAELLFVDNPYSFRN